MNYNLTDIQRYDGSTLQAELNSAAITASINGHGNKSFTIVTDDEAAADVVVQAHLAKSDAQHAADINDMEKDKLIDEAIGQNRNIIKALVLCINDGSIVPGADVSPAALKAAIKNNL